MGCEPNSHSKEQDCNNKARRGFIEVSLIKSCIQDVFSSFPYSPQRMSMLHSQFPRIRPCQKVSQVVAAACAHTALFQFAASLALPAVSRQCQSKQEPYSKDPTIEFSICMLIESYYQTASPLFRSWCRQKKASSTHMLIISVHLWKCGRRSG